ncbi:MAG: 1-deoxy-D-xylulose-5-phosphate synthase [Bacteroidetes bacterium]|nr:1-deoxy-D-xylulose-5-phosphate synthase [Bacteroidota bacterium]MBU1717433.1 1-deoxy-D-xylulose-5-phosphate synthase [Bacteroidota bacterium]
MKVAPGKTLSSINSPRDMRELKYDELPTLSNELRAFIIESVSRNPGHLGASLGTVEISVALHYAFNTPDDKLIWDVGHQAYAHKILTGRRDVFHTNRIFKGISGFPRMVENEYDAFGTGHASTSISAALGMAMASKLEGNKTRQHIAVIGDASISGGMALEALNHAGVSNLNILIILNDNNMAIDKNVGALKEYLTDITLSHTYNRMKADVWKTLGYMSRIGRGVRTLFSKLGNALKTTIIRESNLFQSLNLRYFGPVDGHDVIRLVKVLEDLKKIPGPKLLHCITVKGKGYEFAEKDQTRWHAPGLFDSKTGEIKDSACGKTMPVKYQDVFGKSLVDLATNNQQIVAITPAMISGSGLTAFASKFPERLYDVGIAEQHAMTFAAGLATGGTRPFCCIYSSFMQRSFDQIIHDIAIQKLPVVLCIDRAGLVGEDGATHHGAFDIAYLRMIPNIIVSAPMNEVEMRNLMFTAAEYTDGPFSIRYPRGSGVIPDWEQPFTKIQIGKGRKLRDGSDIAVLTIGHVGNSVVRVYAKLESEGISISHYDMRFVKPIDESILREVGQRFHVVLTVEDGSIAGGFGSAVSEFLSEKGYTCRVLRLGIPDSFVEHGTQEELQRECGFHPEGIFNTIMHTIHEQQNIRKII